MALLQKGDTVAFVAPSACINPQDLERGLAYFQRLGFQVEVMPHVYDTYRYMAGTDAHRALDLNEAFRRPDIKAMFCVRGGGGSTKILDLIDYEIVRRNPKPVFGLSDSTALQNALYAQTQNISLTGFLPIYDFKDGEINPIVEQSLKSVMQNNKQSIKHDKFLNPGKAEGILIGGNLCVLNYLSGTQYLPDFDNKIILLEDIGEKTFRIDLMLNHLRQQKNFAKVKAIILGKFVNTRIVDEEDGTVYETLEAFAKELNIPVAYDFPYGHIPERYLLPIGGKVLIDSQKALVETFPVGACK